MPQKRDDSSAVPEAVRKQAERAAELQKQGSGAEPASPAEPEEPTTPPDNEPAAPGIDLDQLPGRPREPESPADNDKLQTLKGKYEAETARLLHVNRQQEAMIDNLQRSMDALQAKIDEMSANPPAPERKIEQLDAGEYESYGEEMTRLVERMNLLIDENQNLRQTIVDMRGKSGPDKLQDLESTVKDLATANQRTARQNYVAQLDVMVPNWREINNNPKFIEWLKKPDPVTGISMQQVIEHANQVMDVRRVAAIFNAFDGKTPAKKKQLEEQVVPGDGGGYNPDLVGGDGASKMVDRTALKKAEKDFVDGRISEADYDKVVSDFQKSLQQ